MIKIIKTLLLTTFAFFVVINPAYAINISPSPEASLPTQNFIQEREERKERLREEIEAHKEEVAAKKEQVRERTEAKIASHEAVFSDARKTRTREFYGRLYTRFTAAIKRLDILTTRIDSRLASIKEENPEIDTSEVEEKIVEAKSLLLDAQMDLDAANENFDEVLESDDPKATFQLIKDTVMGVKDKLIEVHKILVSVIGDIKGLRVGNTTQITN
jgi:hypothetical protein